MWKFTLCAHESILFMLLLIAFWTQQHSQFIVFKIQRPWRGKTAYRFVSIPIFTFILCFIFFSITFYLKTSSLKRKNNNNWHVSHSCVNTTRTQTLNTNTFTHTTHTHTSWLKKKKYDMKSFFCVETNIFFDLQFFFCVSSSPVEWTTIMCSLNACRPPFSMDGWPQIWCESCTHRH